MEKELDLQKIREQLDQVDSQLVELFEQRMKLCGDVAEYKRKSKKPIFDPEREKQKRFAVRSLAKTPFNEIAVDEMFAQLMTISRRYQYQQLGTAKSRISEGFRLVECLPTAGVKVVYQGVEGAYSHEATRKFFGQQVNAYHVPSWEEAMEDVAAGKAAYAVLPIENSSAGAIIDNYDLLLKYDNYIVGETEVVVNHALLGLLQAKLSDIRTVYSHPQGLIQCQEFLSTHREWKQVSVENTAMAAKQVAQENDVTQAAIASETAGALYGLTALERSINHNRNNTTRFIILAKNPYTGWMPKRSVSALKRRMSAAPSTICWAILSTTTSTW